MCYFVIFVRLINLIFKNISYFLEYLNNGIILYYISEHMAPGKLITIYKILNCKYFLMTFLEFYIIYTISIIQNNVKIVAYKEYITYID